MKKNSVVSLEEELYKRDQQIALFREVVTAVRERFDLESIFQMVANFAQGLINAETVLIPVLDDNCTTYTYRAGCGLHTEEIVGESLDINLGICGWVWKHQSPWWHGVLEELSEDERNKWEKEVGSVMLVPLVGRNHFLGGIAGINKVGGRDFDKRDLDSLMLLASQVAIAIDNNSLIAQLEQTNKALFSEKQKAQVTLSSIGDAVITTDTEGRIEYINPVAERLFGMQMSEAVSRQLTALFTLQFEHSSQPVMDLVQHTLLEGHLPDHFDTLLLSHQDGRKKIFIEPRAAPIHGPDGNLIGVVLVFRDVTQTHDLTQQLSHQATHDELTGLYNRREFEYKLSQAVRDAQINGTSHSLIYMDLDQFKVVNDTCGHVAGDELLKQYTGKLAALLRQGDILARIGGDEFGVLLESCDADQAHRIASKIQEMTQTFHFLWDGKTFSVGVSIGLIGIDRKSESITQIMSLVDAACYMAKEDGRSRIHVHDEHDSALHERRDEMQWSPRITKALEDERIVLFHQPIVYYDAMDKVHTHYEILIRMLDESGALIMPSAFLPAAERYNLITLIDRWVVSHYFRWLAEHPEHLQSLEMGSINLSGKSLNDEGCRSYIESQFREFAIPPEKICFEITETEAIANLNKAIHFISQLKDIGCRFALDDFGSGFSSYAYLKNLPVDFLKIDGMFVKGIASDPVNYAMVESINHIGHVMGRKTIAEFAEDEAIVAVLRKMGVDYMQGYAIAKPHPLEDLA
jgi:diguanylate cyclase (GGDEF)-like protein/PAS domain S-box-containing protein